jgi:heme o synthase
VLFAVIFLWTPPHFWALAMKFRKDYAAAGVPMLPVVASPAEVARKILWYSYAMVAATLALIPFAGWIYGIFAITLGAWFLAEAHGLDTRVRAASAPAGPGDAAGPGEAAGPGDAAGSGYAAGPAAAGGTQAAVGSPAAPMRLFHLSIAYLTLLFAAVAVTALLSR